MTSNELGTKIVYVMRHAKSSWSDFSLSDYDRPLNGRGKRDIPDMGARLKRLTLKPDLIISSPANRAITTARGIANALNYPLSSILENEALYHASAGTIKNVLSSLPDDSSTVMLFGHNPGLTYFINQVSNFQLENLPTCGVCAIRFEMSRWDQIQHTQGENTFYDYPKSINSH